SNEIGVQNSIDPFYIEEEGKKYVFWGSFRGIYYVQLEDSGLSIKSGEKPIRIAGTAYEGTYIHKNNGYYYLFASTGTCCEGLNSTYQTVVGRSKSFFGPYIDKQGDSMMDNHHEIIITKNSHFVGNGHNSEIVTDDAGEDWILYHGVNVANTKGRVLLLDKVNWVNGWPEIANGSPSIKAKKPNFK
ncbi:MAG: family 43 glycosylhydrolase, partial [Muribaculaceae bacterium]